MTKGGMSEGALARLHGALSADVARGDLYKGACEAVRR